jgi:formylglycine-generating enzyme
MLMNFKMRTTKLMMTAALVGLVFTSCDPRGPRIKSKNTGQMHNDPKWGGYAKMKYKGQETGPGLVLIEGGAFTMGNTENDLKYEHDNVERTVTVHSFYMDECEVSNHEYGDFVFWYARVFNANNSGLQSKHTFAGVEIDPNDPAAEGGLYTKILPDTNCWRSKLGFNEPFVEYYFRHPAYQDYPVVGVNWHQANEYAKWRTDRVNEMILDRKKLINFDAGNQTINSDPFNNFNTRAYLSGQDNGIFSGVDVSGAVNTKRSAGNMLGTKPLRDYSKAKKKDQKRFKVKMEDGILLPDYRLPTEAEWEYACKAAIGETQFDNIEENKIYTWADYTIRIKDGKEKDRGKIRLNVMRGKGDYAGIAGGPLNDAGMITTLVHSYWPNAYGLYNMEGNVSEWVLDVYRPLSLEDMDAFMPFRGNKFQQVAMDPNGPGGLADKDDLGRIKYQDVVKTSIKEGGRRNYSQADNIGYKDMQAGMEEPDLTYEYGVTSVINDKARVIKGGNWTDRVYQATAGTRRFLDQDQSASYLGFRCAMIRVGSPIGNSKKKYNKLPSSGVDKKTKRR